ncbi:MAG: hypothetical protein WD690_05630 [Vicinamibacterales bacterium]
MNRNRLALIALIVVVVAFLGGLLLGRSGRPAVEQARDQAELQLDLERARVSILHGRLELFGSNFGNASQQFDRARAPLAAARDRLNAIGRTSEAGQIDRALNAITEAQQLSLAQDRQADAKATEALRELENLGAPAGQ